MFRGQFWGPFRDLFLDRFFNDFCTLVGQPWDLFWLFGGSQIGPEGAKATNEEPSKVPKQRTTGFRKPIKSSNFVQAVKVQGPPMIALGTLK
jgi:hypothetical protein